MADATPETRRCAHRVAHHGSSSSNNALHDILSGTAGGIAQVAVGHPLDTVKVRMQSQTNQGGLVRVLMQGFRAGNLYAGAASPLLGSMAHNATLFFTIGQTQNLLRKLDPDEYWPVRDAFIGGAAVGVAATAVETPVDLLKCKLQASTEHKGVVDAARAIYGRHGIPGLWQGAGATFLRNVPCFSMYFGFNAAGKEFFRQPNGKVSLFHQFLSGAAAGFGFWAILYPLDVIKSRMQIQPSDRAQRPYKSVLHCARTLYEKEGAKIFWRGYSPAIVRALVVNGSVFLAFEVAKDMMTKRSAGLGV